jgi:hypothetical protein
MESIVVVIGIIILAFLLLLVGIVVILFLQLRKFQGNKNESSDIAP